MAIFGFWAFVRTGTEAAEKLYSSVFLPNFSKCMLMFWMRNCESGPHRLSFHWTGPITRGPCALAGLRPQSQIDVGEHNSPMTVACVAWFSLEQPASFDLPAAAALWCCCCHLYRQFPMHNYFCLVVNWIVAPACATILFKFFGKWQLIIAVLTSLKCQGLCLFVYIKINLLRWEN